MITLERLAGKLGLKVDHATEEFDRVRHLHRGVLSSYREVTIIETAKKRFIIRHPGLTCAAMVLGPTLLCAGIAGLSQLLK